jgi:predicted DNA-binding transcriptional regulator AlpA
MPSDKRRKVGKPRPVLERPLSENEELAACARASKQTGLAPFVPRPPPPAEVRRFIYKAELLERIGTSYPTLWGWMRRGLFPLCVDLAGRTAWYEDEIVQWVNERPRRKLIPWPAEAAE